MAKVIVKVIGGDPQEIEASTVQDVLDEMGLENYSALINNQPVKADYRLSDDDVVRLSPSVKGGI